MPFEFVRKITIFPCNHEVVFEKEWLYFWGPPGLALFWFLFDWSWTSYVLYAIPLGILSGIIFWLLLRNKDFDNKDALPKPACFPLIAICGAI